MNEHDWHLKTMDSPHLVDKNFYCGRKDMWFAKYLTKHNISDYHAHFTSIPFTLDLP